MQQDKLTLYFLVLCETSSKGRIGTLAKYIKRALRKVSWRKGRGGRGSKRKQGKQGTASSAEKPRLLNVPGETPKRKRKGKGAKASTSWEHVYRETNYASRLEGGKEQRDIAGSISIRGDAGGPGAGGYLDGEERKKEGRMTADGEGSGNKYDPYGILSTRGLQLSGKTGTGERKENLGLIQQ